MVKYTFILIFWDALDAVIRAREEDNIQVAVSDT